MSGLSDAAPSRPELAGYPPTIEQGTVTYRRLPTGTILDHPTWVVYAPVSLVTPEELPPRAVMWRAKYEPVKRRLFFVSVADGTTKRWRLPGGAASSVGDDSSIPSALTVAPAPQEGAGHGVLPPSVPLGLPPGLPPGPSGPTSRSPAAAEATPVQGGAVLPALRLEGVEAERRVVVTLDEADAWRSLLRARPTPHAAPHAMPHIAGLDASRSRSTVSDPFPGSPFLGGRDPFLSPALTATSVHSSSRTQDPPTGTAAVARSEAQGRTELQLAAQEEALALTAAMAADHHRAQHSQHIRRVRVQSAEEAVAMMLEEELQARASLDNEARTAALVLARRRQASAHTVTMIGALVVEEAEARGFLAGIAAKTLVSAVAQARSEAAQLTRDGRGTSGQHRRRVRWARAVAATEDAEREAVCRQAAVERARLVQMACREEEELHVAAEVGLGPLPGLGGASGVLTRFEDTALRRTHRAVLEELDMSGFSSALPGLSPPPKAFPHLGPSPALVRQWQAVFPQEPLLREVTTAALVQTRALHMDMLLATAALYQDFVRAIAFGRPLRSAALRVSEETYFGRRFVNDTPSVRRPDGTTAYAAAPDPARPPPLPAALPPPDTSVGATVLGATPGTRLRGAGRGAAAMGRHRMRCGIAPDSRMVTPSVPADLSGPDDETEGRAVSVGPSEVAELTRRLFDIPVPADLLSDATPPSHDAPTDGSTAFLLATAARGRDGGPPGAEYRWASPWAGRVAVSDSDRTATARGTGAFAVATPSGGPAPPLRAAPGPDRHRWGAVVTFQKHPAPAPAALRSPTAGGHCDVSMVGMTTRLLLDAMRPSAGPQTLRPPLCPFYGYRADGSVTCRSDGGDATPFGPPLRPGSRVEFDLDMAAFELRVAVDGVDLGIAFRFAPMADPEPLLPALVLVSPGDCATLTKA